LCVVEKDDSPLLAVLVKTYKPVLPTAETCSVQPVGVDEVALLAIMATRKFPAAAAVNVQVCEFVPLALTELPLSTLRLTQDDILKV
jgi:hypothetical protein